MYLSPAELVIFLFGGVRPLARKIGKSASSVCHWRKHDKNGEKGWIPRSSHRRILEVAAQENIQLTYKDLSEGRTIEKPSYMSANPDKE